MLKEQSVNCCQEKSPHLHGVLNGSSVTLMLREEGIDEAPRRFTSTPKKGSNVAYFSFRNSRASSREQTSEMKCAEQCTDPPWEERADECTVPCYSIDMKSTLIEVGSSERQADPQTQRYAKTATRSKQNTVASDIWTETREGRSGEQRAPDRPYRSKETRDRSQERKEKRTDRSNVAPPREVWYGQNAETMYEDTSRPRETFSSENTGSTKHITVDFTSNVDLNEDFPSRSATSHKPRTKMVTEKIVYRVQKSPTRVTKTKSRD
ncbi:uncharacterized protein LOC112588335 [Harpegnathos saltator]|uniref:uncharacterized protein LOC112588335 n=1 Tax=Harpegnathos saltator TaxID=610380 RepID=UPI000DBEF0BE|nr:uncharacterized protein LOC112588335 [Harpegnathos saltator]